MLYGTDSTMENMVAEDLESQEGDNGRTNRSSKVATTILHPMVHALAFAASNKAQNCISKQTAA
jgi:hypothetical protein